MTKLDLDAIEARCNAAMRDIELSIPTGVDLVFTDIPALIARVRELEAENERLREAQRWIPVSERLPEADAAVLVAQNFHRDEYSPITIGRLYQPCDKRRKPYWTFISIQASDGLVYNNGTDFICPGSEHVTHWMPLPAGPEGRTEK